jgi:hypothetical protein
VEAAKQSGQSVRIVAGSYILDDIDELEQMKGQEVESFEVHVGLHELCIAVGRYGAIVRVEDAENVILRGIAAKIDNLLLRQSRWYYVIFKPPVLGAVAGILAMVVGIAGNSYWGMWGSMFVGMLLGMGLSVLVVLWLGRSVISLIELHEGSTFWEDVPFIVEGR